MNCFLQPQSYFQIPNLFPAQVPPCNYADCLHDLNQKYREVSLSNFFKSLMKTFFMPKASAQKVLDKTLTNAQSNELKTFYYDSHYLFNLTDTPYPPYNKGAWKTADNGLTGQDLPSLVRTIQGGSDIDAIEFIANVIGVDFNSKNVPQIKQWEGYSFIRNSHTYPYAEPSSLVTDLLGPPQCKYCFHNASGHPSFFLLEWHINGQTVHLFWTLQQGDHYDINAWEFIAPPIEYRIYNKYQIEANKTLEVHIHDDISNADSSNTSQTIGTWSGDLSFALDMDWSFLKGRKVKYLFDPQNLDSFKIGFYLLQAFQAMGTDLKLYEYYK